MWRRSVWTMCWWCGRRGAVDTGRRTTAERPAVSAHPEEPNRGARYRLRRGGQEALGDDADDRVAPGGGVVVQKQHGQTVGRDLERAQRHALAGEFAGAGAFQRRALGAQTDAVAG